MDLKPEEQTGKKPMKAKEVAQMTADIAKFIDGSAGKAEKTRFVQYTMASLNTLGVPRMTFTEAHDVDPSTLRLQREVHVRDLRSRATQRMDILGTAIQYAIETNHPSAADRLQTFVREQWGANIGQMPDIAERASYGRWCKNVARVALSRN